MSQPGITARSEWGRMWTLPVAAMFGYSFTAVGAYAIGPFIEPLQQEFGWTRARISFGLTISSLIGMLFGIIVGMLVDRFGSRHIALVGVVLTTAAVALFGGATGTAANWAMLWIGFAIANLFMQAAVWTKPIASNFQKSLGLALAVALSGAGLAAMVFPVLGSWLISEFGWRAAFPALAAIWGALVFPIIFFYFRSPSQTVADPPPAMPDKRQAVPAPAHPLPGLTLTEALRTAVFYKLLAVSILFMLSMLGIAVHFVPMLTELGASPMRAAAAASLVGLAAMVGRISTGFMLDRLPGHLVGASVFLLPVFGISLLLLDGTNPAVHFIAAICIGFVLGGEIDVIVYLTTRYMGLRSFGVLFGALGSGLSFGSAIGPLAAGMASDRWDTYAPFLVAALVFSVISSLALASLGPPRFAAGH